MIPFMRSSWLPKGSAWTRAKRKSLVNSQVKLFERLDRVKRGVGVPLEIGKFDLVYRISHTMIARTRLLTSTWKVLLIKPSVSSCNWMSEASFLGGREDGGTGASNHPSLLFEPLPPLEAPASPHPLSAGALGAASPQPSLLLLLAGAEAGGGAGALVSVAVSPHPIITLAQLQNYVTGKAYRRFDCSCFVPLFLQGNWK